MCTKNWITWVVKLKVGWCLRSFYSIPFDIQFCCVLIIWPHFFACRKINNLWHLSYSVICLYSVSQAFLLNFPQQMIWAKLMHISWKMTFHNFSLHLRLSRSRASPVPDCVKFHQSYVAWQTLFNRKTFSCLANFQHTSRSFLRFVFLCLAKCVYWTIPGSLCIKIFLCPIKRAKCLLVTEGSFPLFMISMWELHCKFSDILAPDWFFFSCSYHCTCRFWLLNVQAKSIFWMHLDSCALLVVMRFTFFACLLCKMD